MGSIHYSTATDGIEVGRWFGKSVRNGNTISHESSIYLGKVIDKEKLIFFKRKEGYYHFNIETKKMESVEEKEIPFYTPLLDKRLRERNVVISFGGSYFVQELICGIEYNGVLDQFVLKKPDSMYSLLQFYLLRGRPDCDALGWYQNSYARFLFPQANLSSQRISDFYVSFGSHNNKRGFFKGHIDYLIKTTEDDYAILLDSTGCQNSCKVPVTKVSNHNNKKNIEFRMVIVIQRSTGLPVYYEIIPGNVVDSTTIHRIMRLMARYGFRVTCVFGDAGYSCPANVEKVIFYGSDVVMRLNPAYEMYKKVLTDNIGKLSSVDYDERRDVRYRNRVVRVIEQKTVIGTDAEGNEVNGYVYLCRDLQAYHSKCDHYFDAHGGKAANINEIFDNLSKFGIFAIVTGKKYDIKDIIPCYYQRQGVEQFIDYAKNYAKLMPVRNHNMETIEGHVLMSFIAAFLVIVIKNRMNLLDLPYIAVPEKLIATTADDQFIHIEDKDGNLSENILEQEQIPEVFKSNPAALFDGLNFVGADVFENQEDGENQIIPAVPWKAANDYFKAFGIPCPEAVYINSDHSLKPVYKKGVKKKCTKVKVFAVRPYTKEEEIEKQKKAQKDKVTDTQKDTTADTPNVENTPNAENTPQEKTVKKRGRPKGSKNKKTIEKESENQTNGQTVVKRKRGRPLGSKDINPRKRRSKNSSEK